MSHRQRALPTGAVIAAVAVAAITVAIVVLGVGGQGVSDNYTVIGEAVVSAAAAASAGLAARRHAGRLRLVWAIVALGCAAWSAGEVVWAWYDLVLGSEPPTPSYADVGFLIFPVAACAALLLHPARGAAADRRRQLLDAALVASAAALVSWETVLDAVLQVGNPNPAALATTLAYPLSDLVVLVLAITTLSRAARDRLALVLLIAGSAALGASDSAFVYLAAAGRYGGGLGDLGWFAGFLLLALAPLARSTDRAAQRPASNRSSLLPYLPVVLAGGLTLAQLLTGRAPSKAQIALAAVVVGLVLARQYVTLRENTELARELASREAELRHQAFHDSLTGLANRALFQDRLAHALELHCRDLRQVSVLFLDLDDFKVVNDTLGHASGDELLVRVAERLRAALRTGDTVARLGGDEFAVLLEDDVDPLAAAARVEHSLTAPFRLGSSLLRARASIGLVTLPSGAAPTTADDLLSKADTAMYAAKRDGKGRLRVHHEGMHLLELDDARLGRALAEAISTGALHLEYQPIVAPSNPVVRRLEALCRWTHDGAAIPPDTFIPIAVRSGLIDALTAWVLEEAAGQVAAWTRAAGRAVSVSVNVGPSQIVDPSFPGQVQAVLERHELTPDQLVLEITETALLNDVETAREVVGRLRSMGIRIALDDFGIGFSSLARLREIELDCVKIDRSFIEDLDGGERQTRFLDSVLRLATGLGLEVVAEGVETEAQLAVLRTLGCALVQGYLLGRPADATVITALLEPLAVG